MTLRAFGKKGAAGATAAPGAVIADRLTVSVDAGDGLLPSWGVRRSEDGLAPVEAVVESTLHGPFADPVHQAPAVPEGRRRSAWSRRSSPAPASTT